MQVLVTYDVSTDTAQGRKRLRKVAQVCLDFGQRVQKSVFECSVNQMQYEELRSRLLKCIDLTEDSLRIYRLREPKDRYIEHFGINEPIDLEEPLIF